MGIDRNSRKFLLILGIAVVPFCVLTAYVLTSVFGSPTVGVRCVRERGQASCAVLQSRLFGFAAESSFVIPEADIRGVEVVAPRPHPGRGGGQYSVDLLLKTGPYATYPVLSSYSSARAESAARKLNAYFADPGMASAELHEDRSEYLIPLAPLAIIGVVLAGRALRRGGKRSGPAPPVGY